MAKVFRSTLTGRAKIKNDATDIITKDNNAKTLSACVKIIQLFSKRRSATFQAFFLNIYFLSSNFQERIQNLLKELSWPNNNRSPTFSVICFYTKWREKCISHAQTRLFILSCFWGRGKDHPPPPYPRPISSRASIHPLLRIRSHPG